MCAAPSAPTLTTLTTEGLKQAGISNPSSTELTRAEEYMEQIKNDLVYMFGGRKLTPLYSVACLPVTEGKSRYSNPTDYLSDLEIDLMWGTHYGTAQDGAVGYVTLAAADSLGTEAVGKNVLITSGTGVGSFSQITAYNDSTKIAIVTPDFTTAPVNGSGYMVVDNYKQLIQKPVWELSEISQQTAQGTPSHFFPVGDADYGEFELWPIPYTSDNMVYGLRMRYYADLGRLDLAGTTVATLYQNMRNLWIQGVKFKSLEARNQTNAQAEGKKYNFLLQQVVTRFTYGNDLTNLRCRVMDY